MGLLTRLAVLGGVAAVGLYLYDEALLKRLGQQAVEVAADRTQNVSLNYYGAVKELWTSEKTYKFYSQVAALALILYVVFFKKAYDPSKKGYGGRAPAPLTKAEQEALIEEWTPRPLIEIGSDTRPNKLGEELVLTSRLGPRVNIENIPEPVLNLSGFDFLGMSQQDSIREKSKECLARYGCGSCGPRGFYGA